MNLFKKALYFSALNHDGQYRKGVAVPYIAHPVLVSFVVRNYTDDEEVIAAALLHDTLEDCPNVTADILSSEFGQRITNIVLELTKPTTLSSDASWEEKKESYINHISAASPEAMIIIAADKLVNMEAYFNALKDSSEATKFFKGKPEQYLWYYEKVYDVIQSVLGQHAIAEEYSRKLSEIKKST